MALETGWTPDVLAALPERFLAACRWVMYARTMCGPDGVSIPDIPRGAPPDAVRAALAQREQLQLIRGALALD